MIELARTADPVRLSWMRAVLAEGRITCMVFDAGAQALWPGAFESRLMVAERDAWMARRLLDSAEGEGG